MADLLGKEYFLHAYGPIYALSADVVTSLVALKNNRQDYVSSILFGFKVTLSYVLGLGI